MILALLLTSASTFSHAQTLKLCVVLESGFTMLKDPETAVSNVTSDSQLVGYEVSLRQLLLTKNLRISYTVTVMGYAECQVCTRLGEYDIGWAHFYHSASRERCQVGNADCQVTSATEVQSMLLDPSVDWTPYRCCVDYFHSPMSGQENSLVIVSKIGEPASFFSAIFNIFVEPFFVNYLSFLFIWVTLIAHLIWYLERSGNSGEFPQNYMDGIDDAIWWSFVTVTTVGYGDKCPRSMLGRVLGIIWMIIGVSLGSILTGYISNRFIQLKSDVGHTPNPTPKPGPSPEPNP